jgi:hypothetical protein
MIDWSIRKNATLVILDRLLNRLGLIDRPQERRTAQDYIKQLNIATDSLDKSDQSERWKPAESGRCEVAGDRPEALNLADPTAAST